MRFLIFFILGLFSIQGYSDEVFYQKCVKKSSGQIICEKVVEMPTMKYKKLELKDISVGGCYKKELDHKIVFFKVSKIKKNVIFAFSQVVRKSSVKDFNYKIYVDNYPWNGQNFNDDLEEFPCSETPSLSIAYLKKICKYRNQTRGTLYCEKPRKVNSYERTY